MIPIINFPVQIDKETWEVFKARLRKDGIGSAKEAIYRLIRYVIENGMPDEKPSTKKKDKDK